ncbi:hypothetical protein [Streptomyces caatingaensis]|uniref:Uncharacterized protein n=1 Tax=Streptomyces caatingaensis TaxID=1678637 RepID=A0A0K9XJG2_9ACTN|nr:hypothetical protein [Streptomyces caatingaensis]KNB52787.1 hypothetical protein AC230_09065 [Streptomyces caatingaensis]
MPTPTTPPPRFRDPGHDKHHFARTGEVLVRCPRCDRRARVVTVPREADDAAPAWFGERRLVCRHCGLARRRDERRPVVFRWYGAPEMNEPCFQALLWLQTRTRHGLLWAYDPEHLALLRQYVQATLREHDPWHEPWRKMGLVGRLPAWIKQAKNRDEVLRGLDRLRASLADRDRQP